MTILFTSDTIIELNNIAFTSKYNSNLILLRQLYENSITYYNQLDVMTLMKNRVVVAHTKRK